MVPIAITGRHVLYRRERSQTRSILQVIQVDGLPELRIQRIGRANVALTWTESGTPLTVEESPDLKPGTWSTTARPIFSSGDNRQIIIPGVTGKTFFRLKREN